MSSNVTHAKEPLFRMVKRDAIPQKKAWMIRAAAFLLSLATGAVVIMMLGHNPFSVYISMKREHGERRLFLMRRLRSQFRFLSRRSEFLLRSK